MTAQKSAARKRLGWTAALALASSLIEPAQALDSYSYWYGYTIGAAGSACELKKGNIFTLQEATDYLNSIFSGITGTADKRAVSEARSYLRRRYTDCPI